MNGILHLDVDFSFGELTQSVETDTEGTAALYAETGTTLLRKRLYALLDGAGIAVKDGADGIEIWYNQDDSGAVEIERVRVCVTFSTDIDRAAALLRSVLTEAIRTDVFAA